MARIIVPEAEEVLDHFYQVLNHGFVRLVDYLGGDSRIVQSARVSYGKGTKTRRKDKGLINYMLSHAHTSPFEQVVLVFHCKMPIFVARQWVRHRTARLNEISGRYSVMTDEFYLPAPEDVRYQSERNKQGSSAVDVPPELQQQVLEWLKADAEASYSLYQKLLETDHRIGTDEAPWNLQDAGISRELARINLPLSLYTQWYWQIDLNNLFRFLWLRMDSHAQWEIRQYANVMAELTKKVSPLAFDAFEEHMLFAEKFNRTEMNALREMAKFCPADEREKIFKAVGLSTKRASKGDGSKKPSKADEFEEKLAEAEKGNVVVLRLVENPPVDEEATA